MDKDILFFKNSKEGKEEINAYLSLANANLGYTLVQAIMEYIDNAIDAKDSNKKEPLKIALCFYEGRIIIIDNGTGLKDVKEFFEVVMMPQKRKKEHIGLFSCGSFSAFSVASRCSFISRTTLNGEIKGISLYFDQVKGGVENESLDRNGLEDWFNKINKVICDDIFTTWRSIVVIEEIHPEKNRINLSNAKDPLYARLGQRYLQKLLNKSLVLNLYEIIDKDSFECISRKISFVDPTFNLIQDQNIKSIHKSAFCFKITMREVALEVGYAAADRFLERYKAHYEDEIDKDEFYEQELQVKYYVLKPAKEYDGFIAMNPRYAYYKPGGRSLSTGFYVYRNGIGIGDAAFDKTMGIDITRQEINRFKAVIECTPIFDELLGINIRKDNLEVVEALAHILARKLKESIRNFLSSLPNPENYEARELAPYIKLLFKAVDEQEEQVNSEEKEEHENNGSSGMVSDIDNSQLKSLVQGILTYSDLITLDVANKLEEWDKKIFTRVEEYNYVLKQANAILENISVANRLFLLDLQDACRRVEGDRMRRVVRSKKYSFLCDIDEPHNEQETVFFLLRILENSNRIVELQGLQLARVFAYEVSKGIDFIGVTSENEDEYMNHVNSVLNCSEYLDKNRIYDKYKLLFKYRYVGVEVKPEIFNGMSVGHSLATSRFLVAWKARICDEGYINAEDGKYIQISRNNGVYMFENSSSKHKINVLILKEWGRDNGVFTVGNKRNN